MALKLETIWLTKYPRPTQLALDRGTKFMAKVISLLRNNYHITCRPTTTRNLQANAILEQAHQTTRNIIHSFQIDKDELNMDDPGRESYLQSSSQCKARYILRLARHQ